MLLVGHYTFGRGDDSDTQSINHARHFTVTGVLTHTGRRNSLEALDCAHFRGGIVLQGNFDSALGTIVLKLEVEDIALVEENLRDFLLQVRRRNFYNTMLSLDRVAKAGQKVCYGISHYCGFNLSGSSRQC